ncbi:hypothetical protein EDD11_000332, partial [Mortierella claussenii]
GRRTLGWCPNIVPNYRAQIRHLYPGTSIFDKDADFDKFFQVLRVNESDTNSSLEIDLTPALEYICFLGPNKSLPPLWLTQKVYWLLGLCAFLRPRDIERIDLDNCALHRSFVILKMVRPKEKSQGVHKDKFITLKAHPTDAVLCPVAAFLAYKQRLEGTTPIRTEPIGHERISNYIKAIVSKIQLPEDAKPPKARAARSTIAARDGVAINDKITQGNWSS